MKNDFQTKYLQVNFVKKSEVWAKHVYKTEEMESPMNVLDCSFHCLHVEKPNGCEFFAYEASFCNKFKLFLKKSGFHYRTQYAIFPKQVIVMDQMSNF